MYIKDTIKCRKEIIKHLEANKALNEIEAQKIGEILTPISVEQYKKDFMEFDMKNQKEHGVGDRIQALDKFVIWRDKELLTNLKCEVTLGLTKEGCKEMERGVTL